MFNGCARSAMIPPVRRSRVVLACWLCAVAALALAAACSLLTTPALADEWESAPISYSQAQPDNAVSQLQARLEAGESQLAYESHFGYLRSFLKELGVPESSQMLVFSKTSLQRQRISPRTPRALYFNDEAYVGFCQYGDVLEVSVADAKLGTVFYTLPQEEVEHPIIRRQTDNCLLCHASSQTHGVPGHVVRSVYADPAGQPILSSGTFRIDHTSPLKNRWGGWYVTGMHGEQKHLGNMVVRGRQQPEQIDNSAGQNQTELDERVDRENYLSPHSDIVALMVLEHQAEAHNCLTRASFETRIALEHEAGLNRELKMPPGHRWESTTSRIRSVGEPLVKYLLFSEEAPLTASIRGTSEYAAEFAAIGPRDPQSRSLRDFDLQRRLFKYPCSYLIYSPSFDALPDEVRDYVLQRMWDILQGTDSSQEFAHLTAEDRQAILEILRATKPNLPAYWQEKP